VARKLSDDEIRIAACEINKIYYSEGNYRAREAADELQARMVMAGNTDSDSIYIFEKYSGMTYQK
jgi:hypothetical protein